jgi:hypothetical protein
MINYKLDISYIGPNITDDICFLKSAFEQNIHLTYFPDLLAYLWIDLFFPSFFKSVKLTIYLP